MGLWGAAYILDGGCSDDGFEYFRCWLIAQGRDVCERALVDPETLADVPHKRGEARSFEGLLGAFFDAYQAKARRSIYDDLAGERAVTGSREPAGKPWKEDSDDLKRRFPRLWKKFGW